MLAILLMWNLTFKTLMMLKVKLDGTSKLIKTTKSVWKVFQRLVKSSRLALLHLIVETERPRLSDEAVGRRDFITVRCYILLMHSFQRTMLGIAGERLTRRVRGMLFKSILKQVSKDTVTTFYK